MVKIATFQAKEKGVTIAVTPFRSDECSRSYFFFFLAAFFLAGMI